MKKGYIIGIGITEGKSMGNEKNILDKMKEFLEDRTIECLADFTKDGNIDSLESLCLLANSMRVLINSQKSYQELLRAIENEDFGQIGIISIDDFFEDFIEYLIDK